MRSEGALDVEGKELPHLVYVSRDKRPGYNYHKKAGAMNALVGVSLTKVQFCFSILLASDKWFEFLWFAVYDH